MTGITLEHDWFPEPLPHNVSVGESAWLYSSFAFRHYRSRRRCGVRIGEHTGIYNGTFFDLGPGGQVSIGEYCTLVGAIICTNQRVVIDSYVFIAHEVVLADSVVGLPGVGANQGQKRGPQDQSDSSPVSIRVHENAWVGARAVLLEGARIGEGAIIGAAAVVDYEVPPYSVVAGNPSRIVRYARSNT